MKNSDVVDEFVHLRDRGRRIDRRTGADSLDQGRPRGCVLIPREPDPGPTPRSRKHGADEWSGRPSRTTGAWRGRRSSTPHTQRGVGPDSEGTRRTEGPARPGRMQSWAPIFADAAPTTLTPPPAPGYPDGVSADRDRLFDLPDRPGSRSGTQTQRARRRPPRRAPRRSARAPAPRSR